MKATYEVEKYFQVEWKPHLTMHPFSLVMLKGYDVELTVLWAIDLRFRDSSRANIQYLNELGSAILLVMDNTCFGNYQYLQAWVIK